MINIWQFQRLVSQRLIRWGLGSVLVGMMMRSGNPFWRNVGNQFIAWGAIDAGIGFFGKMGANERADSLDNPGTVEVLEQETKNLRRILWINTILDVFYVIGGLWWTRRDKGDGVARGNGWGVVIQGAFLFVFDLLHVMNLPDVDDKK